MAASSGYQRDLELQAEYAFQRKLKAARRQRKCLRCGSRFPSWGPGNRLCRCCKRILTRETCGMLWDNSGSRPEYRLVDIDDECG